MLRPPSCFPDSVVGLLPDGGKMVEQERQHAEVVFGVPFACRAGRGRTSRASRRRCRAAVCCDAALPTRTGQRILVAGQPADLPLDELLLAFEAVHDLHLIGAAGERAQEPVLPRLGFFEIAGIHQREQGKGGVAQPAVAVVPVALAADRSGSDVVASRDDAAGWPECERLERDERALDCLAILSLVLEARGSIGASRAVAMLSARRKSIGLGSGSCEAP